MTSAWTPARIRALGARTDVPTACAILGMSERTGRDLVRRGTFPVAVLRLGAKKQVVPTAAILVLLGIAIEAPARTASSTVADASEAA